jgi:hypothetical protein
LQYKVFFFFVVGGGNVNWLVVGGRYVDFSLKEK